MSVSPAERGAFRARHGRDALFAVHAPGRVNLMGDHIDYLGLPVLPLALPHGITMLVAPRPDQQVRLTNLADRFPDLSFDLAELEAPPRGTWADYVRAGIRGSGARAGFDALVSSTLPIAAGLSSSSALVVAAALASLRAAGAAIDPLPLAERLARAERAVGTEGGGMDQAACLCGVACHALRVAFEPLRVEPVPMPGLWQLLVVPSLTEAHKAGAARAAYNERSRSAARALAVVAGEARGDALLRMVRADPERFDLPAQHQPRLRHVVSELIRVDQSVRALRLADLQGMGELMNESHASLRDDYEVSTPELDEIAAIAVGAGARGARLTGAGFGGSAIALCTEAALPFVRAALRERYYAPRGIDHDPMFVAEAAAGARVIELGG